MKSQMGGGDNVSYDIFYMLGIRSSNDSPFVLPIRLPLPTTAPDEDDAEVAIRE